MQRYVLILALLTLSATSMKAESTLIDVLKYEATVRFEMNTETVRGDVAITLRNAARGDLDAFSLDLAFATVSAVSISGSPVSYTHADNLLTITPDTPFPAGDTITVRVQYAGSPDNEGGPLPWGGCHWGDVTYFMGVGFTTPEISVMRYWLPCNDIPSDKATFDVTFEVPQDLVVAGTGVLAERPDAGAGYTAYRWVESHPTATYLFTYAISDYAVVEDSWNSIPMQYFVPRADSTRAVAYFSTVPSMMEAFTARFGPYPFDKVGYCITPIGSMEHQTMISYAASLFTGLEEAGSTAAHELAHMWWGDLVTCRDFGDAWLNEGFAVFSEMLYEEYLGGEAAYREKLRETKQRYRISDSRNEGIFPLHDFPRATVSNYPATIYHKGGAVMAMLREVMGDTAFFEGLLDYAQKHAYANASTEDLQAVMEMHHGSELGWFFDEWVFKAGWPDYIVQRVSDNSSSPLRIQLLQTQDSTKYPFFRMPLDLQVVLLSGDTVRTVLDSRALSFQEFSIPEAPANDVKSITLDPRNMILKSVGYRTVGISPLTSAAREISIGEAYPQPYNPSRDGVVSLPVTASEGQAVQVVVHDLLGRTVATLYDGFLSGGTTMLRFDGSGLPRGIYLLLLRSGTQTTARRVVLE
ncbi:T9SS type A sorting domain-containing protein [bacterium]|nr:T9SS type A sorting domain-containing protein [bacterium]